MQIIAASQVYTIIANLFLAMGAIRSIDGAK